MNEKVDTRQQALVPGYLLDTTIEHLWACEYHALEWAELNDIVIEYYQLWGGPRRYYGESLEQSFRPINTEFESDYPLGCEWCDKWLDVDLSNDGEQYVYESLPQSDWHLWGLMPGTIECPNHEGNYDCNSFCRLCEGYQEYTPQ